jgi:8-oxo-dGTP diphosphatase
VRASGQPVAAGDAKLLAMALNTPQQGERQLARFVALHEVPESDCAQVADPAFAVVIARSPAGIVLVFNRWRKVWELPGGLIDAGESARDSAARELAEEAGCIARNLTWLGLVEVADTTSHFGGVFACDVDAIPADFQSEEIGAVSVWRPDSHPRPLGDSDAALLNRFG